MQYRLVFCLVAVVLLVGTASADILILYIDNTSQDGSLIESTDASWQTLRNDAGAHIPTTDGTDVYAPQVQSTTTSNVYSQLLRGGYIFNTSKLDDTVVIDSAVFSLYVTSITNTLGNQDIGVTSFSPISFTTLSNGDYDSFGNARIANDIPYASVSTGNYNNFTINNLSLINTTGYFPIMIRDHWDINNNSTGLTWASGTGYARYRTRETSYTGGDSDPFLTITYHTEGGATPPVASFTTSRNFIRIPNSVTVTDTSSPAATSWAWSWGDGTANSTTQNPSHQYLKRGKFDIILTATNAGGSGTSGATSVKVVGYETYT